MSNYTKQQYIFALSFLSNSNFGDDAQPGGPSSDGDGTLWGIANATIKDAVNEKLPGFGINSNLTWGPYVSNSMSLYDPGLSVTDNLVYVASVEDPENSDNLLLVVSLAGTSSTSYYAAFSEDFYVDQVNLDLPGMPENSAMVYKGGRDVISALITWKDVNQPVGIPQGFLANLAAQAAAGRKDYQTVEIVVTGHSLGGGLAPILAAYLGSYSNLLLIGGVSVSCYTYAGPTAGDADFIQFLADQNIDLNAVVNEFDIVPKALTVDGISSIYSLYGDPNNAPDGLNTCTNESTISDNGIVAGIAQWAQSLPNGTYANPDLDSIETFPGAGMDFTKVNGLCTELDEFSLAIYTSTTGILNSIRKSLEVIYKSVKPKDIFTEITIKQFLTFLDEGSYQHVRGYIYYLTESNSDLQNYLLGYMQKGTPTEQERGDSLIILNELLSLAATFLQNPEPLHLASAK